MINNDIFQVGPDNHYVAPTQQSETICNESSTGLLLLADVMPAFAMNIICPYIIGYTK